MFIRGRREQGVSHTLRAAPKIVGRMMPGGAYQLVAIRGGVEVFRAGFNDRDEAYQAFADALARYPDCEVRLTSGDGVLISAGPAPSP